MKQICTVLMFLLLLGAPLATWAADDSALLGTWYGDGGDGEEEHRWAITRYADGTFKQQYLFLYHASKEYEQVEESGRWQHREGIYIETNQAGEQAIYRVLEMNAKRFEYIFLDDDDESVTIVENKVFDGFEMADAPRGYTAAVLE